MQKQSAWLVTKVGMDYLCLFMQAQFQLGSYLHP